MSNTFRFKQFEVDQSGCAMRINTDGVLLAAMAEHPNPQYILDIGTGTGVIALMLAQRYSEATVAAVEIDEQASETARKNFRLSVFWDRISIQNVAIEQYNNETKFDLIVSNPPFFVNDYKSGNLKKEMARHASGVFFEELIAKVSTLLSEEGFFWFVLPIKQAEDLVEKGLKHNLFVQRLVCLHSDAGKPAFRKIVCLGRSEVQFLAEDFIIYEGENEYTSAYKYLLKNFFLAY